MVLQTDSRDEARRAYQEALRLQPASVEAYINLGLLHHNAGDLEEAEISIAARCNMGPDSALAQFNLAVVLEDQKDKSGALLAHAEALKRARIFGKPILIWLTCTNSSGVNSMPSVIMTSPNACNDPRERRGISDPIAACGSACIASVWLMAQYLISLLQSQTTVRCAHVLLDSS